MPKVSVIIPNYNHALFLEQRIESVLNQSFQDFELILLDDNSTDHSLRILAGYKNHPRVSHLIVNTVNSGSPFCQWNRGVAVARGHYLWIAESDDWAEPDFLQEMVNEVEQRENVVIAFSLAKYMNCEGNELWKIEESMDVNCHPGEDFIRNFLVRFNSIYNVSMTLLHRETYLSIDFSTIANLKLCGDWLLYVMLCRHGNVIRIGKALSNYRIHDNNTSTRAEKEGQSFLEGIHIFNYIQRELGGVERINNSFYWSKQWVKYQLRFNFSASVQASIRALTLKYNKLIFSFYFLYRWYYRLKKRV